MNAFKIGRVNVSEHRLRQCRRRRLESRRRSADIRSRRRTSKARSRYSADAPPSIDLHYLKTACAERPTENGDPLANVDPRTIGDFDVAVAKRSAGRRELRKLAVQTCEDRDRASRSTISSPTSRGCRSTSAERYGVDDATLVAHEVQGRSCTPAIWPQYCRNGTTRRASKRRRRTSKPTSAGRARR